MVTVDEHGELEGGGGVVGGGQKERVITNSKEDVVGRIQVSLASRAAEELFLDVNLNGVTSDFASATELAARYIGVYGMDGTLTSFIPFVGAGASVTALPKLAERIESVLQSQFKAVKRLLQQHSEALIAIAEAPIQRDQLLPEEITHLLHQPDPRPHTP